jgi:hypothetical protein
MNAHTSIHPRAEALDDILARCRDLVEDPGSQLVLAATVVARDKLH